MRKWELADTQRALRDATVRITELESLLAEQDAQLSQMRDLGTKLRGVRIEGVTFSGGDGRDPWPIHDAVCILVRKAASLAPASDGERTNG